MKNIKVVIALLSALLISSVSYAGELTVTGNAKASLNIIGSDNAEATQEIGKTLAIENEFVFGASGELDNGTAWKYSVQLDQGSVDDPTITLTNNWGTVGIFQAAGGLNAKHFGSANAIAYGSQYGRGNTAGEFYDPTDIGGLSNIQYHTPAGLLPLGTVVKVAKGFAGSATNKPGDALGTANTVASAMNYSVDMAPVDGLTLQASYYAVDALSGKDDAGQQQEAGAYGAKYAMGNFTLGYTKGYYAPALGTSLASGALAATAINYYENDSYSVGLKVNDNLSISYGTEESTANKNTNGTNVTAEIDTYQIAYTMGGMTVSAALKNVDNYYYTADNDLNEATVFLTLAF
jgi:hypothetical protein